MSGAATVRTVAAGAGFAGDRIEPAVAMASSGIVDDIVLECLAERTLVQALRARREDPRQGYDPRLRRRLTPLLPVAREQGCRIVSNLGAANPSSAARAACDVAASLGLPGLKVAAVCGDDLAGRLDEVQWERPIVGDWLGAHAYLGIAPIVDALEQGADVVITGRVADSALFAACAYPRLLPTDDALAGALAVGHILECAGQLTGGNLASADAALPAPDLARLGYPLAHIAADGSAELTVLPGAPARLDALTCALQLLYEVHDPARYITPDAILDLSGVRFEVLGENRVGMSGARYAGRPDMLKVVGFVAVPGVIADVEIAYAGDGATDRAEVAAEVLRHRLRGNDAGTIRIDRVGIDSVLGAASAPSPAAPREVRVHVSALCADEDEALAVEDEVYGLTLAGPAGGCCIRSERRPCVETVDGFVARSRIVPAIQWSEVRCE